MLERFARLETDAEKAGPEEGDIEGGEKKKPEDAEADEDEPVEEDEDDYQEDDDYYQVQQNKAVVYCYSHNYVSQIAVRIALILLV